MPNMSNTVNSPKLSETEIEILKLRESGETIRAIAQKVHMSEQTVQNHINRVATRFGFEETRGNAREEKFRELVYPLLHSEKTIEEPESWFRRFLRSKVAIFLLGIVLGLLLAELYFVIHVTMQGPTMFWMPWQTPPP